LNGNNSQARLMDACKICQNAANNRRHIAREMMFGLRDPFTYLECSQCGCVQLLDIPPDMAKYYPKDYYSFQPHGSLMTFLRHQWSAYAYGRKNLLGWIVARLFFANQAMMAVRRANIPKDAHILDVGCGSGHLLLDLHHLGFRTVAGVDPYLQHDLVYPRGPTVFKRELSGLQGQYDLIMLHHAYEHMDQPAEVMRHLARLLKPTGKVILRIPIADSYAWRHYNVNWVNLDAPRHFYLHTRKSIEILASQAGLKIEEVVCEGTAYQFWCSEQYLRDIPLTDPRSCTSNSPSVVLTRMLNREFKAKSDDLNKRQEGDLACFYLRKAA